MLPAGKIAVGKLLQALVFGARVISVRGNFDEALRVVRALSEQDEHPITLVNSVNPFRLEGQKTAAFEVCDDLGRAPDILAIPVGNAGNISAYWRGFREYRDAGRCDATPRMWGFQAAGAAPLVLGHPVEHPGDRRHGDPHRQPGVWTLAIAARDDVRRPDRRRRPTTRSSRPTASSPALEGVFCEPSSAASVAGVIKRGARRARSTRTRSSCACSPATASRTRRRPRPASTVRRRRGRADHRRRQPGARLVVSRRARSRSQPATLRR